MPMLPFVPTGKAWVNAVVGQPTIQPHNTMSSSPGTQGDDATVSVSATASRHASTKDVQVYVPGKEEEAVDSTQLVYSSAQGMTRDSSTDCLLVSSPKSSQVVMM